MKTNTITAGAVLRLTQESDIALLPAIERSAAQAFRQIPSLAWLADSEVISVARHHDYLETEHSLLAEAAGQPIGFILTEPLDDALFIVEVAVHQNWQHQGIGRMARPAARVALRHAPVALMVGPPRSALYYGRKAQISSCNERLMVTPCCSLC